MNRLYYLLSFIFLLFPIYSISNGLIDLLIYPQNVGIIEGGQNLVPITYVVQNIGPVLFNVTFYQINRYPFYSSNYYNNTQNITINEIPTNGTIDLTFFYYIAPNINPGIYESQIGAYENFYGLENLEILNASIPLIGYTNFSINSFFGTQNNIISPYSDQEDVPITFVIINDGNIALNNVTIYFTNNSILDFYQNSYYIGILPIGTPYYLTTYVNINNVSSGSYNIPLNISYFDGDVQTLYTTINIGYTNIGINSFTDPPVIYPGDNVLLNSILFNYGNQPAGNIYLYIDSPFNLLTSDYYNFGILEPGQFYNISSLFYIPKDTKYGIYPVTYEIYYNDLEYNYTYYLNILPEANISIEDVYYNNLNPGSSEVPIILEIKNIGSAEAKNLVAYLGSNNVIKPYVSSSDPLEALTASELDIGNLYPNQSTNLTFIVKISSGANYGSYSIPIIFLWNQTEAYYPFEEEENINVNILEPIYYNPTFYINIIKIIILPIIVILGLILFKKFKKKKKDK
ncbi:S-layer domain-like protein [Nanobdella aerobiophila]|uniref:S-layer domain-like protein n=1 Tax=Nanobdella aerobiophila TaxID=2586965 RepID=A0A915SI84_9ARCH|nr:hypothetical protein [Nanobdella aerobiophila]BBL45467.1 S-layer domain-like protein [Nanobdella aerobiophila]